MLEEGARAGPAFKALPSLKPGTVTSGHGWLAEEDLVFLAAQCCFRLAGVLGTRLFPSSRTVQSLCISTVTQLPA